VYSTFITAHRLCLTVTCAHQPVSQIRSRQTQELALRETWTKPNHWICLRTFHWCCNSLVQYRKDSYVTYNGMLENLTVQVMTWYPLVNMLSLKFCLHVDIQFACHSHYYHLLHCYICWYSSVFNLTCTKNVLIHITFRNLNYCTFDSVYSVLMFIIIFPHNTHMMQTRLWQKSETIRSLMHSQMAATERHNSTDPDTR